MYVLKTLDGFYYTGRAGEYWLSRDYREAFTYSWEEVLRKREAFNKNEPLHRKFFCILEDRPA